MDENAQTYFDLEEKIPPEDLERYKKAIVEERLLAVARVHDRVEEQLGDIKDS